MGASKLFFLLVLVVGYFSPAYSSAQVSDQNLLCHLKFDGTARDDANRFTTTTDSLYYTFSRKDKANNCLELKNNKSNLAFDDSAVFENTKSLDLTISLWLKTGDRNISVWSKQKQGENKNRGISLSLDQSGNPVFTCTAKGVINSNVQFIVGKKIVSDGSWHHLTSVIENSRKIFLYTDGVLDTTVSLDGTIEVFNKEPFILGSIDTTKNYSLCIDGFKIHGVAASAKDVERLYKAEVYPYNIMVWLNNPNSANNSCTFLLSITPDGQKVSLNTGKYEKMAGYSIAFIDKKLKTLERFDIDKQDYLFDIRKWGGFDIYFMQVFDPTGSLEQVTKINLTE